MSLNPSYTGKRSLGFNVMKKNVKSILRVLTLLILENGLWDGSKYHYRITPPCLNPSYTGKRSLGAPYGNCLNNNEL